MTEVLKLLGWSIEQPKPGQEPDRFARIFEPLGEVFDLEELGSGKLLIRIKVSRIEELEVAVRGYR